MIPQFTWTQVVTGRGWERWSQTAWSPPARTAQRPCWDRWPGPCRSPGCTAAPAAQTGGHREGGWWKFYWFFLRKKKTFSDAQQIQTRRKVENNMFLLFSWNIISKDRIYYVLKKVMYISKTSHTFRSINQSCWFLQWNYTPIISTWFNRAFLQLNLASFPAVKQPNLSYRCYITGTQFIWTQGYRDYSSSGRLLSSPPYHAYLT